MAFEVWARKAAPLAARAVPAHDKRPQLAPLPCRPGTSYSHVTSPVFDITATLSSTGTGRRACSPAANNSAAAASSLERFALAFVTLVMPEESISREVCANAAPSNPRDASVTPAVESRRSALSAWTLLVDSPPPRARSTIRVRPATT